MCQDTGVKLARCPTASSHTDIGQNLKAHRCKAVCYSAASTIFIPGNPLKCMTSETYIYILILSFWSVEDRIQQNNSYTNI